MNELEKKYEKLIKSVYTDIQRSWHVYNYIFSSKENIDTLNKYKNNIVFYLFQKMASDSIILGLNRLFDPYNKKKDDDERSLSLHYFKCKLPDETQRQQIGNLIGNLIDKFTKYEAYRNNKLGHNNTVYKEEVYLGEDIGDIIEDTIVILEKLKEEFRFENVEIHNSSTIIMGSKNKNINEILDEFLKDIKELGLK